MALMFAGDIFVFMLLRSKSKRSCGSAEPQAIASGAERIGCGREMLIELPKASARILLLPAIAFLLGDLQSTAVASKEERTQPNAFNFAERYGKTNALVVRRTVSAVLELPITCVICLGSGVDNTGWPSGLSEPLV